MVRDPRRLDQNPVVIDPANVDAVLDDRPTPVSNPSQPALDEIKIDNNPRSKKLGPKSANSRGGTPVKSSEPRRR